MLNLLCSVNVLASKMLNVSNNNRIPSYKEFVVYHLQTGMDYFHPNGASKMCLNGIQPNGKSEK